MNLSLIGIALSLLFSLTCFAETVVRVRPTPGGPQIFVNNQPVRPRWFFGTRRSSGVQTGPEWTTHTFDFAPSERVDGRGTLHFRFGQSSGEVWLADVRVFDVETRRDILPRGSFATPEDFAHTWNIWPPGEANTVGRVRVEDETVHVTLTDPPSGEWPDFHLYSDITMTFEAGHRYRCSFRARSNPNRKVIPAVYRVEGGVWTHIGGPLGVFLKQVALARDAGIRFISFDAPNCWRPPEETPNFGAIDEVCNQIIEAHPDVLLVPRVSMNAPPWWLQRHPEARMVYEDGQPGRLASISHRGYRSDATAHLETLCRHLSERFPNHFAGIHPCGQNTGEWFYEGSWGQKLSGYDPATREAWRNWLRERGLPEADPPSAEARHAAQFGLLRDPAREQLLIEFSRFQQTEMADMVLTLADAARRGTESKKLVLFFYGYHYEFGALPNGAPVSGHYALDRLLRSGKIDILCSPISYTDRGWLGTTPCMSPAESISGAGILWLNEDDTRTHLSSQRAYNAVDTLQQTQDVMRRNTAMASLRGFATWWMDLMGEGWFAEEAIWDVMRELEPLDQVMLRRANPFTPEIAAIVGEESMICLAGGSNRVTRPLIYDARAALGRCGAPYGQYTLKQAIEGKVPAKLQFYLASWMLTPEQRKQLARRRSLEQTRVWCYAPGYLLPDRADVEAMTEVTGFSHHRITLDTARATPTEAGKRLGLLEPWGPNIRIDPLFTVEASSEETLATYDDGSPAVTIRRGENGIDIFVGVPQLTPELVRAFARLAGVHLFVDGGAFVWAADNYLLIQALTEDDFTIHTSKSGDVHDAVNGELLGDGPELMLKLRKGESRILRY